jgi:hypothetical protein
VADFLSLFRGLRRKGKMMTPERMGEKAADMFTRGLY